MTKAAVLGSPIEHSLSPIIHQAAYKILGWDWKYERHLVRAGELSEFITSHAGEFRGLSLTMPLKEEAIPLLDVVTDSALGVNAVNTVIFDELGIRGFNTDIQGFRDALSYRKITIPESVAVLGGGATARSAIAAMDGQAREIYVYSRSAHRSKALVNSAAASSVHICSWDDAANSFERELVISTTPKGATDNLEPHLQRGVFFESLYDPWPTPLLAKWRALNGATLDGLDLLVWQAIGQLELMALDGVEVSVNRSELFEEMRTTALTHLL